MQIPVSNSDKVATDFRDTATGPEAFIDGAWYSVNGTREQILVAFPTVPMVPAPLQALRRQVTGRIEAGAAVAITEQPAEPTLAALSETARLLEFARATLEILQSHQEWGSDTLDAIGQEARRLKLGETGDESDFRSLIH